MNIEVRPVQGNETAALVHITGEFMLPDSDAFKACLEKLLDDGRVNLVLDLNDLSYIVSSGLGMIIMMLKKARAAGGDLKFLTLNDGLVKSVFKMTRFDELIETFDDVEQALAGPAA